MTIAIRPRLPRDAIARLRAADPRLGAVIDRVGPYRRLGSREGTHFDHLVRAILYQQLSGKAARTIYERVLAIYGGRRPTPDEVLATSDEALRGAGVSRQKLGYMRDLAARVAAGEVAIDRLDALSDDDVVQSLTRVKGVGVWTAQMFLMFRLGRLDVLPSLDLGIQTAVQRLYGMRKRPKPAEVEKIGARWRPYATVACWYLWRSLD